MYTKSLIFFLFLALSRISVAQVGIGTDSDTPDPSSMLDVQSSSRGVLIPRMTFQQRNAIPNPAEGLLVYCTNCKPDASGCVSMFHGGLWINLAGTCDIPLAPAEAAHVQTNGQITWNWNPVPIATGYKWNTTNDYQTATDVGNSTTLNESGLTTGNVFVRYVWAYNVCGNSPAAVLEGQALACGTSFMRIHFQGSVAPVSKTVTYGTVTNVPGEPSKCWITRNLGATQQPNSVSDNTEASAGWYWQFNRKQGYRHDGANITPSGTWPVVSEDSDWISANDPCSSLLGSVWRIPTFDEWNNVEAAGNWSSWAGPWNSVLQLHAAGTVFEGGLNNRGSQGWYNSSIQVGNSGCRSLTFSSGSSTMTLGNKNTAVTLRCIRD